MFIVHCSDTKKIVQEREREREVCAISTLGRGAYIFPKRRKKQTERQRPDRDPGKWMSFETTGEKREKMSSLVDGAIQR